MRPETRVPSSTKKVAEKARSASGNRMAPAPKASSSPLPTARVMTAEDGATMETTIAMATTARAMPTRSPVTEPLSGTWAALEAREDEPLAPEFFLGAFLLRLDGMRC